MLSKLMQVNSVQESIIRRQAAIIDELFMLVCQYTNIEGFEGIEPLLTSMRDAVEMEDKLS